MKKTIIFAAAILCSLPLLFSFKNTVAPPVSPNGIIIKAVPMENQKAIKLRMANLQKKPVRILIKDLKGNTLYSEKVLGHNGYRQLINLRNLEPGEYMLHIMHPIESKVGTIELKTRSVEVSW